MIKLDLITGFLGAGKTTFIKKYGQYLIEQGERICIIENDFGAINVDMMLLKELEGPCCNLEMVVGGDGEEAHKRRLKTKLISMAMLGFSRVIIEPSGIYDVDEFFDLLNEEPLDNWYEIGNVISIFNVGFKQELSLQSRYLMMSEAAHSGIIILSHLDMGKIDEKENALRILNDVMKEFSCNRVLTSNDILNKDWDELDEIEKNNIVKCGFNKCDFVKMSVVDGGGYQTLFYFDFKMDKEKLIELTKHVFEDGECGIIHRIKGIIQSETGDFYELNTTRDEISTSQVSSYRPVLIVIGEGLRKDKLSEYFGKPSV